MESPSPRQNLFEFLLAQKMLVLHLPVKKIELQYQQIHAVSSDARCAVRKMHFWTRFHDRVVVKTSEALSREGEHGGELVGSAGATGR